MKYTKNQLLGSIFSWGDEDYDKYEVISFNEDVCLKNINSNELFKHYNVKYLNEKYLSNLDITTLNSNEEIIEDPNYIIEFLHKLNIK